MTKHANNLLWVIVCVAASLAVFGTGVERAVYLFIAAFATVQVLQNDRASSDLRQIKKRIARFDSQLKQGRSATNKRIEEVDSELRNTVYGLESRLLSAVKKSVDELEQEYSKRQGDSQRNTDVLEREFHSSINALEARVLALLETKTSSGVSDAKDRIALIESQAMSKLGETTQQVEQLRQQLRGELAVLEQRVRDIPREPEKPQSPQWLNALGGSSFLASSTMLAVLALTIALPLWWIARPFMESDGVATRPGAYAAPRPMAHNAVSNLALNSTRGQLAETVNHSDRQTEYLRQLEELETLEKAALKTVEEIADSLQPTLECAENVAKLTQYTEAIEQRRRACTSELNGLKKVLEAQRTQISELSWKSTRVCDHADARMHGLGEAFPSGRPGLF